MNETIYYSRVELAREKVSSFQEYPFSIPAIKKLKGLDFKKPVTFFIGENGSGKSTLIEAIAVKLGFNAEGGNRDHQFATRASHSELHHYLYLHRTQKPSDGYFLRSESFYNLASELERLGAPTYGAPRLDRSNTKEGLHEQSHGESFFSLLNYRIQGGGFYLFDEPEAALSPQRQLSMLTLIQRMVDHRSQLLIATHSPILMAYPNATIYQLNAKGIHEVAYQETAHYQITKNFLDNPERMLRHLLVAEEMWLKKTERH